MTLRVAAAADLHFHPGKEQAVATMLGQIADEADVLLLAGNLTDTGTRDEALALVEVLDDCQVPMVTVLGNHDYHHHEHVAIQQILARHDVAILDGDGWTLEHDGVRLGVGGTSGFGGGFRPYNLTSFGEDEWKGLVEKITIDCRKLDRALAAVRDADYVIAMTHYSPTIETMGDEPEPLYPFLGRSELGDRLERQQVHFAIHGHAHIRRQDGHTPGGVSVFNVALPLIKRPRMWQLQRTAVAANA